MLLTLLTLPALAAEVVWLSPPSDEDRARVAQQAGAKGPPLEPIDLLAAATRWTADDERALEALDRTLAHSRRYEGQLDGEVLILRDLDGPLARIGAIRDDADRSRVFAALLYQGFAANRLGDASEAAPYRAVVNGEPIERPWLDAIALDPEREATPYEIAEAPQRVAYNQARARLAGVLPATLTPKGLPEQARLVVDGRTVEPGPSGNVKVRPGRHLVHVELDGRIVGRWDARVASGDDVIVTLPLSKAVLTDLVDAAVSNRPLPGEIGALVKALGGEVWLATPGDKAPSVWSLTPTAVTEVELERAATERGDGAPVELSVGALGGWLSSGDFYAQDPANAPRTRATVNAIALGGWASADVAFGPVRLGAGVDLLATTGAHHAALTGDGATRLRPVPHVAAGVKVAQVTAGYLFPYHPALGARARLPLGPVELRLQGWYGLPADRSRPDGSTWDALPVRVLVGGGGVRF